ncbi:MAG: hypothetical protein RSB78_03330, partial [Oscillospiraceae bacterium]
MSYPRDFRARACAHSKCIVSVICTAFFLCCALLCACGKQAANTQMTAEEQAAYLDSRLDSVEMPAVG